MLLSASVDAKPDFGFTKIFLKRYVDAQVIASIFSQRRLCLEVPRPTIAASLRGIESDATLAFSWQSMTAAASSARLQWVFAVVLKNSGSESSDCAKTFDGRVSGSLALPDGGTKVGGLSGSLSGGVSRTKRPTISYVPARGEGF